MKYIDVKTASEKWGLTTRRVRILCNDGRIDGAVRNGWSWVIPSDTPRPKDGRVLRRYKPLDVRVGTVDVDALEKMKALCTPIAYFSNEVSLSHISRTLSFLFALSGEEVDEGDVYRILTGNLVPSLSLETHLVVVNFNALLFQEKERDKIWGKGELERLYSSLMRGIDKEKMTFSSEKEESLIHQYETGWSNLHPLTSSVLLSSELMKASPEKRYSLFFYYLVFAGELMRGGFIPPSFGPDSTGEAKAAFALASSKSVYLDMMSFLERMMERTYMETEKHV